MNVIVSGGGTGGHIYPAIAIAGEFRKKYGAYVVFVGAENGMEKDIAEKENFHFYGISTSGFSGRNIFKRIRSLFKIIVGVFQSFSIIKDVDPDYVIGTGGFASAPLIFAAGLKGRKCFIQEQNVFPGRANLFLSRYCIGVFTTFEESKKYFSKAKNIYNSGNPVRSGFYRTAVGETDCDYEEKAVENFFEHVTKVKPKPLELLIVGGSGGASAINDLAHDLIDTFTGSDIVNITLITGKRRYDMFLKMLDESGVKIKGNIKIIPYEENMPGLLNKTELIISRSGATTLSEIIEVGIPAILIPSPNVKDNHQEYNAKLLESAGMAFVYIEKSIVYYEIESMIRRLASKREILSEMRKNADKLRLSKPAGEFIVETIVGK